MTILLVLIGVYAFICLALYALQSRLVFYPDRQLVATPQQAGLNYSDVFFETEDGVRLHGWFVPSAVPGDIVLFFHGNAGNISHRLDSIRIFYEMGLSVFVIDYRGYGRSAGRIDEPGSYRDADAALRYLMESRGIDNEDIIYFGRSLGSAVAIELATHSRPKAVIAESCFSSIPDIGAKIYPWLPVRLLARVRYDSMPRVAVLTCPKLFVHSRDDEILPFQSAERLYEAAAEPKRLLEIRGDHNSGFMTSGAMYVDGLMGFLRSLD